MASKTAVVGLPLAWLLAQGGNRRQRLLAIVPHLLIGAFSAWWTLHVCESMLNTAVTRIPSLSARLPALAWAGGFYLWKFLIPIRLNLIYPHTVDVMNSGGLAWWGPLVLMGLVVAGVVLAARRDRRMLGIALAIPLLLAPASGLLAFAYHMHSMVADHFVYPILPLLVLALLVPLSSFGLFSRPSRVVIPLVCILAGLTSWRAWETGDSLRMMRLTCERNPSAWAAWSMYGEATAWPGLDLWKKAEDAEKLAATYEREDAAGAFAGTALRRSGEIQRLRTEALAHKAAAREKLRPALALYEQAARVQPGDHVSWFHLARLHALLGDGEAAAGYERALQAQAHLEHKVKNVDLYYQAAAYFAQQGQTDRAKALVREALAFAGTHPGINALADALGIFRTPPSP
jgi:hypothetical protein